MARTVLVTGAAGFIGAALSQRLLQRGDRVVGLDNLNDYYDPASEASEVASDRGGRPGRVLGALWKWPWKTAMP